MYRKQVWDYHKQGLAPTNCERWIYWRYMHPRMLVTRCTCLFFAIVISISRLCVSLRSGGPSPSLTRLTSRHAGILLPPGEEGVIMICNAGLGFPESRNESLETRFGIHRLTRVLQGHIVLHKIARRSHNINTWNRSYRYQVLVSNSRTCEMHRMYMRKIWDFPLTLIL